MNYGKIDKFSVVDGNGIRVVLWVSGCTCYCKGCHNPETRSFYYGQPFDEKSKLELFEALDKTYIKGITFSGGHPLERDNIDVVYDLCKEIKHKFPTKDIWVYTGYTFERILTYPIMDYIDVLVDGRYIEAERDITLKWRGSKNQRVINVPESFKQKKVILYCD